MKRINLNFLVIGGEDSGKNLFKEQFLKYAERAAVVKRKTDEQFLKYADRAAVVKRKTDEQFSKYAERAAVVKRKTDEVYVIENLKELKNIAIWFHDIKDVTAISIKNLNDHVIFFCFSLNQPKTLINLEKKWIKLLSSNIKYRFLVAKEKGLPLQENGLCQGQDKQFAEEIKKFIKTYQLKSNMECIDMKIFLDQIMHLLLNSMNPEHTPYRRRSHGNLPNKEPTEGQSSPNSIPKIPKQRSPYIKQGKSRSDFLTGMDSL